MKKNKVPIWLESNAQDRIGELYMDYLDIKEQYNIDTDLSTYNPTNRGVFEDNYIKELLWEKKDKGILTEEEEKVHVYINTKYMMKSIVFKDITK